MKEFLLFIKYPYTAGVIATVWLGTAILLAIEPELPMVKMVVVDMVMSIIVAAFGFRGKQEV